MELEGDSTEECRVWGLEVYYNSKGYGQDKSKTLNSAVGTIDNENNTITIPAFSYLHMATSTAYYYISGLDAATYDDAESVSEDIVLTWNEKNSSLDVANGWVTVTVNKSTGKSGLDDAYDGGISFVRK